MEQVFDPVEFNSVTLPAQLAAGNGALAVADVMPLGPLGLVIDSGSWTYVPGHSTVTVSEGVLDESRTVVQMSDQSFADLARDLDTPVAMLYGLRATVTKGNPLRFIRWEPALRAMFHGRPIYDPANIDLRDRDGAPIDPMATFSMATVSSDPGVVAHQLVTVGFIVVRQMFTAEEIAAMRVDAEGLRESAQPGDGVSWWGRTAAGQAVATRVLNGATRPGLLALYSDERVQALVAASGLQLQSVHRNEVDGVTVLWKIPDMAEGLARK